MLYTIRTDGSEISRIGEAVSLPTWSADGELLAFVRHDEGGMGVHTARYDGSHMRPVVEGSWFEWDVSQVWWSPDGAELLLMAEGEIFLVKPDGSGLRRLGPPNPRFRGVVAVAWSADGARIAARLGGPREPTIVLTMARDGTDVRVLEGLKRLYNKDILSPGPEEPEEHVSPQSCSAGLIVPELEENPGLVEDCEALLRAWPELDRRNVLSEGEYGWSKDVPLAEWGGVTIGGEPLRIRGLALSRKGMEGTVPVALADLMMLQELDLSFNRLVGGVPVELRRLQRLEELDLSGNRLSGAIPSELSGLEWLETLDLSGNSFSGAIPPELGDLPRLRWLDLSRNALTGDLSRNSLRAGEVGKTSGSVSER